VIDSRIVRSSGATALDEEALALLRRAQPFPVWPREEFAGERVDLTVSDPLQPEVNAMAAGLLSAGGIGPISGRAAALGLAGGYPCPNVFCGHVPVVASALIVAAVVGILVAGTVALWAHYGTAVFYEMIRRRDRRVPVSAPDLARARAAAAERKPL